MAKIPVGNLQKTFFMGLEFLPDEELLTLDLTATLALIVWS